VASSETFRLKTALAKDITLRQQTQMTELQPATLYTALAVGTQHSVLQRSAVIRAVDDLRTHLCRLPKNRIMEKPKLPEPWLRGTLTEVDPVQRAVLHALELAKEDLEKWCGDLSDEELNDRPADVAPIAFHFRHIARSTDRLLTYAENQSLSSEQIMAMKQELELGASRGPLFAELTSGLKSATERILAFPPEKLSEPRAVGRQQMPTTVAGLIIHVADHAQRHVGQAVTTAKVIKNSRADK
jgi:uncharacterized damage-inducible protein DinB